MSIRFRCPECNAEIKVSERHAGQKGRCSTCSAKILVPTLEQAAEMKAKEREARQKAAPPAAPPATPSLKSPPKPTPIAATEPEIVSRPRPEVAPTRLVEKSREPVKREEPPPAPVIAAAIPPAPPNTPALPEISAPELEPEDDLAEPAEEQFSLPDDFFDGEPVETPDVQQPVAAKREVADEEVVEVVEEEPIEAAPEDVAVADQADETGEEDYSEDEEAFADRELVTSPAASLSSAEGNDILSAVSLDPHDLIHLEGDDDDHPAPLVRKSVGLEGVEELVDMTAMVDIVFFLLIFFMMTTMQNVSASIETPAPDPDKLAAQKAAATSVSVEDDANSVKIRIEADNSIQFDGERVAGEQDLRSRLAAAFPGGGSSKKLFVMGHGDAYHGTVVMVLDAAHSNGIQDIRLAVVDEEQ